MAEYVSQTDNSEESEKPNPFTIMTEFINKSAETALRATCEAACENMRQKLTEKGHVRSGELVDSIDFTMFHMDGKVAAQIKMAKHGQYIDEGTGAAHGVENGREGYWSYKDKNGQWHSTNGMDADPFIDESILKALTELPEELFKELEKANDELQAGKAGGST